MSTYFTVLENLVCETLGVCNICCMSKHSLSIFSAEYFNMGTHLRIFGNSVSSSQAN